jgi:malonyl CoA-acyl carrier protein transacylase
VGLVVLVAAVLDMQITLRGRERQGKEIQAVLAQRDQAQVVVAGQVRQVALAYQRLAEMVVRVRHLQFLALL